VQAWGKALPWRHIYKDHLAFDLLHAQVSNTILDAHAWLSPSPFRTSVFRWRHLVSWCHRHFISIIIIFGMVHGRVRAPRVCMHLERECCGNWALQLAGSDRIWFHFISVGARDNLQFSDPHACMHLLTCLSTLDQRGPRTGMGWSTAAKPEQIKEWYTCLVSAYVCIRDGAYMMKFKPKLLFFQI